MRKNRYYSMTTLNINMTDPDGTVSKFELEDPLIGFDSWKLLNPTESKIISSGGGVDDSGDDLTLKDTGNTVAKFKGAKWSSPVGATGDAECELCESGCSPDQTWEVVGRD